MVVGWKEGAMTFLMSLNLNGSSYESSSLVQKVPNMEACEPRKWDTNVQEAEYI
jgi:hypothetical protein